MNNRKNILMIIFRIFNKFLEKLKYIRSINSYMKFFTFLPCFFSFTFWRCFFSMFFRRRYFKKKSKKFFDKFITMIISSYSNRNFYFIERSFNEGSIFKSRIIILKRPISTKSSLENSLT